MNELIVKDNPTSSFSEEIKKVRTNLKFLSVNDSANVIMLTSALPGEGKSFITSNLAISFAQAEEKVLIIDCDLRKGRQRKAFNISPKEEGLSNLLIKKDWSTTYENYIKETEIKNLDVIATGAYPPNPSELLASERFGKLLKVLKEKYDIIFLDCPPIIGLNDALEVSSKADVSILVANQRKTSMKLLSDAKKELEKVGAKNIVVILNQTEIKNKKYYYGGYYTE